jgi:hypothetical protein
MSNPLDSFINPADALQFLAGYVAVTDEKGGKAQRAVAYLLKHAALSEITPSKDGREIAQEIIDAWEAGCPLEHCAGLLENRDAREWLIWSNEHRAWWGPERCGYPLHSPQAGRYTLAEARDICRSRHWDDPDMPPETMIHVSEVDYAARR